MLLNLQRRYQNNTLAKKGIGIYLSPELKGDLDLTLAHFGASLSSDGTFISNKIGEKKHTLPAGSRVEIIKNNYGAYMLKVNTMEGYPLKVLLPRKN